MGLAVGFTDGPALGTAVGFTLGTALGFAEGAVVGATLGLDDGLAEGATDGCTFVLAVGLTDGGEDTRDSQLGTVHEQNRCEGGYTYCVSQSPVRPASDVG